jgi:hypothetical protein
MAIARALRELYGSGRAYRVARTWIDPRSGITTPTLGAIDLDTEADHPHPSRVETALSESSSVPFLS